MNERKSDGMPLDRGHIGGVYRVRSVGTESNILDKIHAGDDGYGVSDEAGVLPIMK